MAQSEASDGLLPATSRALLHRVATGQAEGRAPSLIGAVVRDGRQVWCGSRSMLAPLGMTRTAIRPQSPHAGGFAVHPWADVMQPEPAEHTGLMAPAGDMWSTTDDLSRFAAFLLDGDDRVLGSSTLKEMRRPLAVRPHGIDARIRRHAVGVRGRRRRRAPGPGHIRLHAGALQPRFPARWPPARGRLAADLIAILPDCRIAVQIAVKVQLSRPGE
jgi:hypothetical protein